MPGVADIRLAVSWRDHPKRQKLQRRLGADGVVAVIDLWCWAGEERPSGRLDGMSAEDVEIAANWRGAPGRFIAELVEIGLLECQEDVYVVHGWEERQGWAVGAERRSASARENVAKRWEKARNTAVSKTDTAVSKTDTAVIRPVGIRNTPLLSVSEISLPLRDPSTTGSGHGLQALPRMFSAGDVERLYLEATSKPAHPQACLPLAQAIATAAASKACDPADLAKKIFGVFPAYRAHCKSLGWDVHPSLLGIDKHIDRLLLWLDGEKPVGQQPERSPPMPGGGRQEREKDLPAMYRKSAQRRSPST